MHIVILVDFIMRALLFLIAFLEHVCTMYNNNRHPEVFSKGITERNMNATKCDNHNPKCIHNIQYAYF